MSMSLALSLSFCCLCQFALSPPLLPLMPSFVVIVFGFYLRNNFALCDSSSFVLVNNLALVLDLKFGALVLVLDLFLILLLLLFVIRRCTCWWAVNERWTVLWAYFYANVVCLHSASLRFGSVRFANCRIHNPNRFKPLLLMTVGQFCRIIQKYEAYALCATLLTTFKYECSTIRSAANPSFAQNPSCRSRRWLAKPVGTSNHNLETQTSWICWRAKRRRQRRQRQRLQDSGGHPIGLLLCFWLA